MKSNYINSDPKHFRVKNYWFDHEEFKLLLRGNGEPLRFMKEKAYVIKEILNKLQERLEWWNRKVFGWVYLKAKEMVRELNKSDLMMSDNNTLINPRLGENKESIKLGWTNLQRKESLLRKNSKQIWVW